MKTTLALIICAIAIFALPACSLLQGSADKAREVAEKREAEFNEAVDAFVAAEAELKEVLAALDQAIKDDDKGAIEKLTAAAQAANAKYDATRRAAESAEDLFQSAVDDFKEAKSAEDYVGTVLGWLSLGLNAVLGTGAAGAFAGRARAREALKGTTAALEKTKSSPEKWPDAKRDMQASLSTGALKLIDRLRPS